MNVKPIRTKKDYEHTLSRIDELIAREPKENSPDYDELDVISTLVEAYEATHYPIKAPNPVEAIKYIMEEKEL